MWRSLAIVGLVMLATGACTHEPPTLVPVANTYAFGPFTIAPNEEISDECISIPLHNETELFVNRVELTTGPGFHHSNWFFVPENTFQGPDGVWKCDDRSYTEPAAALFGGVLFAQSTQAPHEKQQFPAGVALKIPPHHKLVAQIHLLNRTDAPLSLAPWITLEPIPPDEVTTLLAAVSFENQALQIPTGKGSRFTLECDLGSEHQRKLGRAPDFKLYYGLAHYHDLGVGLSIEAVKPDGTAATVFETDRNAGDVLGGPIAPLFDMTGYTKLRFTCAFENFTGRTVRWGIGDDEMCVFLAFSDSPYNWGGGATDSSSASNLVTDGNPAEYEHDCAVYAIDAGR